MKKMIGLAVLMLTGLTAFAAPAPVRGEGFQKAAIVAHTNGRGKSHRRGIRKANFKKASFRAQRRQHTR